MSYSTISQCVNDKAFADRVTACFNQEQLTRPDEQAPPLGAMTWAVACASDVEQAYAYALSVDNPNPGGDETVITDAMILSHVQANWPTQPESPSEPPPVMTTLPAPTPEPKVE